MMIHHITRRQSPPLGDLRTKQLVHALMDSLQIGPIRDGSIVLPDRVARATDIRTELGRRETLGVGVRP